MRKTDNNKYRCALASLRLFRIFRDETKLQAQGGKERDARGIRERRRRAGKGDSAGVSPARKTKGQRRIKSIADKAAGQDAGAHLVSPGEWAFIMMPPGTNNRVHFVSPARGNNGADGMGVGGEGRRKRRRKRVGCERPRRNPTAILTLPRCSFVVL